MALPSASSHSFARVPRVNIPRSTFNRTSTYKTTFNASKLIPFFVEEVLPGDTMNLRMTAFARLATPLHPFMDNLHFETFFFFVPNRLTWQNWERFNGAQDNPDDSTDFVTPKMTCPAGGYAVESIFDYMGLPTVGMLDPAGTVTHVAFYLRAYNKIWNDWFRDQNLQDSVQVPINDGPDNPSLYTLLPRGKRHDYFTSSLPWPQKGPSVDLPLGTRAPISGIGVTPATIFNAGPITIKDATTTSAGVSYPFAQSIGGAASYWRGTAAGASGVPDVYADLSEATAATINQLRMAIQIQGVYEQDARGGTRYVEILLSHFGVQSPDYRLQRPEFLGGGYSPINISPVTQQSESTAESPQGNLAAIGTMSARNHGFTKSFTEHGVVIGLMCVRADITYQQGLDRKWFRSTRWDYFWPGLAHIGEQPVLQREIYIKGTAQDNDVWGYQEKDADYRYRPSMLTGKFRSTAAGSLDTWHLAQELVNPVLNEEFIAENVPVERVVAVTDEPQFIFDSFIVLNHARPMPVYSVPGLITRF